MAPTIYYARVTLTHMLGDIQPDGSNWIDAGTGEALGGAAWAIDLAMPRR